jgi:cytoskeletal protein CcmA (bactofilin family)
MFFNGSAQILGTFEGRITSKGEVFIGEGAACKASIEAARVIVEGAVEGDITAHERAELHPTACVTGDLAARALIVAEGATFTGHFRVGVEPVTAKPEKRPATSGTHHAPAASVETRPARPVVRSSPLAARAQRLAEATADLEADAPWQGATA